MAAWWQNVRELFAFQEFMKRRPGGGWPEKVDAMIAETCREQGVPVPMYVQVESNDLEILRRALRSGRIASVTYSISPTGRYGGARIAHMVNLLAAGAGQGPDGKGWWCVMDNNYPNTYEWMCEAQFQRTYASAGRGWAFFLCNPAPPPAPTL